MQKYPGEGRKRWHVRWLVRGGSSCGLSGGWRGFAIDQVCGKTHKLIAILVPMPRRSPFRGTNTYILL